MIRTNWFSSTHDQSSRRLTFSGGYGPTTTRVAASSAASQALSTTQLHLSGLRVLGACGTFETNMLSAVKTHSHSAGRGGLGSSGLLKSISWSTWNLNFHVVAASSSLVMETRLASLSTRRNASYHVSSFSGLHQQLVSSSEQSAESSLCAFNFAFEGESGCALSFHLICAACFHRASLLRIHERQRLHTVEAVSRACIDFNVDDDDDEEEDVESLPRQEASTTVSSEVNRHEKTT